jgi:hypothetical protein
MAWEIAPWRPFRELERMRRDMDRVWDSFFGERPITKTGEVGEWLPSLDMTETKNDGRGFWQAIWPSEVGNFSTPSRVLLPVSTLHKIREKAYITTHISQLIALILAVG